MAKNSYDPKLFNMHLGRLYYGDFRADTDQKRFYQTYFDEEGKYNPDRAKSHKNAKGYLTKTNQTRVSTKYKVDPKIQGQFPKGTDFREFKNLKEGTETKSPFGNRGWASSLAKGKSGKIVNETNRYYKNPDGRIVKDKSAKYGEKRTRNAVTILKGHKEFIRHLQITQHALTISAFNFKVAVGKRAVKVFQDSFDMQQFNSAEGAHWPGLADFTIHKREKRGTFPKQNPILREYLDLQKSIVDEEQGDKRRVTTKPIAANPAHHKKYTGCWAYFHNEGVGTYGRGFNGRRPKPYVKRQFMGFSTKLSLNDGFMAVLTRRILFDGVFLSKS